MIRVFLLLYLMLPFNAIAMDVESLGIEMHKERNLWLQKKPVIYFTSKQSGLIASLRLVANGIRVKFKFKIIKPNLKTKIPYTLTKKSSWLSENIEAVLDWQSIGLGHPQMAMIAKLHNADYGLYLLSKDPQADSQKTLMPTSLWSIFSSMTEAQELISAAVLTRIDGEKLELLKIYDFSQLQNEMREYSIPQRVLQTVVSQ